MKIIKIFSVLMAILILCSCTANSTSDDTGKYANSKYTGIWYNADSADEKLVYELKADGTAIYEGTHKGVWEETDNGISITITKDKGRVANLEDLLNGKEVKLPTFNFTTGSKEYRGNTLKLKELEIKKNFIEKWNGVLPSTVTGDSVIPFLDI